MKKSIFFFLFLVIWSVQLQAQTVISGKILDENEKNLSGATVTVSKDSTSAILAYGISDAEGSFRINIESASKMLFLKVSFLGYANWSRTISHEAQQLQVQLTPSSEALKEVLVESKIIEQRGDTLSYSVSAFKDQKDRVLADVLKKMPGIEIMPGGQIHYQGKPIEKYYIEGLDLLEGRYSLANNNLSADDVSKVQILENHQPVKVLDSLTFSERTSLNVKLKKDVTISGTARLGSGFSPFLWKANVTPMIFTKKQQAIVSYQANNTGNDVSAEIRDFSLADFGRKEFGISKKNWLNIRQLSPPPFEQERWLDNNVHLGSVNYLKRLKNETDLKINILYLNDTQRQVGATQTRYFTPTDTIDLVEEIRNDLFISMLQSKFTMERNTNDNYLKNELELNGHWDSQRGFIDRKDSNVLQRLSNPFSGVRNKLRMLKPVGNQLITFRSNTGYTEANQHLNVFPGQFKDLINDGEAYAEVEQAVSTSSFFTDNSAGFTKKLFGISLSPEVGFSLHNQNLESDLAIIDENETDILAGNFRNNLNFYSSRIYFTSRFVYEKDNWSFRISTPLTYSNFDIEDEYLYEAQEVNQINFEPSLFIRNKFSAFWETSVSINFNKDFGDIDQMYYGFILNNYRSLQRFNSPLPENFGQTYNARLKFRNPLKSIFASTSYTFGNTESNLLYSNLIDANAATVFEAIEQENTIVSHNFDVEGSKYFSNINTTLGVGANFSLLNRDQLLNGTLADVNNQNLSFDWKLEAEVASWLSTSYRGELGFLQTSLEDRKLDAITTQQHSLDLFFYVSENQYLSANSEYYFNNLSEDDGNNYFLNLNYQYSFNATGIDLEASWNNVLNTNDFIRVSGNEYAIIESTYRLRPSQVLLSLKFSF